MELSIVEILSESGDKLKTDEVKIGIRKTYTCREDANKLRKTILS